MSWEVDIKVVYLESKVEFNKKGNPVSFPVEFRKLYVKVKPFLDSGDYRVFYKKARAERFDEKGKKIRSYRPEVYTICVIPRVAQSIWTNPSGKVEVWYQLAPDTLDEEGNIVRPYKRTDDKPMDRAGILRWLTRKIGLEATNALVALETVEPQNLEAA